MKIKFKWSYVVDYIVGNIRYHLYYNAPFLIRKHILEQITNRILVMNPECYLKGSCIKCGCSTTALQMCKRSCEGNCYGKLLNKRKWEKQKTGTKK